MSEVNLDQTVTVPEEVFHQVQGEELVLLNRRDGSHYGLDAVGRRMWELILERPRLRDVLDVLLTEYDVAPDVLERDVLRLTAALVSNGLLQLGPTR